MGVLVEDLLLLARMDEGMTFTTGRFDLAVLAARAVEGARAADPERRIELHAEGPVDVDADEDRLQQVLDNLLANARAHTPEGAHVSVTVAASSDGGGTVEVADDGPGVPLEHRGRVFERFYRADDSRSRGGGGGAGLGLAIAAEIARAHGGTLTLVPTERGATFRLSVPPRLTEPERRQEATVPSASGDP